MSFDKKNRQINIICSRENQNIRMDIHTVGFPVSLGVGHPKVPLELLDELHAQIPHLVGIGQSAQPRFLLGLRHAPLVALFYVALKEIGKMLGLF